MLKYIKEQLIEHPDKLKDVLEYFGYCNVIIRDKYISCGRDEASSKKSIVIRLENNEYVYVTDYARNINKDIFSYISEQRHIEFSNVIAGIKNILGISDYYFYSENKNAFGGFYTKIRKKATKTIIKTYDESILNKYIACPNRRFIKDNISITTQKYFNIMFDTNNQAIVIPIYNQLGEIMGIKERANWEVEDGEQKYWYEIPCRMSNTLYGYSHNYNYFVGDTLYIFEAEKSVMQCYSYGIRNCVALGSGTLSKKQAQMIHEAHPKKVIFMHDNGYEYEHIKKNIKMLEKYYSFSEIEIGYWDWTKSNLDNKYSPSDLGKKKLEQIINEEIIMIGVTDES